MMTVTVSRPAAKGALSVPSRSITRIGGKPTVFLRVGEGFAATPVSIRGKTVDTATIEGEISAGQEIAVTGIVQLEKMLTGG
jgi:cobalt-zinc-cadmium efflux system membrane fusion protein